MMDWAELGKGLLNTGLPLLGAAFGGPLGAGAGSAVASMIAGETGAPATDPAKLLAAATANPETIAKLKALESKHRMRLQEIALAAEQARLLHAQKVIEAETHAASDTNRTMRAEIGSGDRFVRWSRPSMTYVLGLSVLLEVIVASLVFWFRPEYSENLTAFFIALSGPQALLLRAIGIWVSKRTEEKAMALGHPPAADKPGMLPSLVAALRKT